jgi:hypothetical protein
MFHVETGVHYLQYPANVEFKVPIMHFTAEYIFPMVRIMVPVV